MNLQGSRVYVSRWEQQGVVIEDTGARYVRVQWDEGDATWSRRDLLRPVASPAQNEKPAPTMPEEG